LAPVAFATTKTAKEWKPDDRDHDTALRSRKRDAALGGKFALSAARGTPDWHGHAAEPGRRAANAFHADATEHLDGLVSALGRAEREQFRHAMQTILAATQEMTP